MNNLSDTDNNTVEIEEEIVLSPYFNEVEDASTKFIHDFLFHLSTFQRKTIGLQSPDKNEATVLENLSECLTFHKIQSIILNFAPKFTLNETENAFSACPRV